jgi:hypothetical protein
MTRADLHVNYIEACSMKQSPHPGADHARCCLPCVIKKKKTLLLQQISFLSCEVVLFLYTCAFSLSALLGSLARALSRCDISRSWRQLCHSWAKSCPYIDPSSTASTVSDHSHSCSRMKPSPKSQETRAA